MKILFLRELQIYQTSFDVIINDWQNANLLAPSVIRCHKIATLEKNLVIKKLGSLNNIDFENFKSVFNNSISVK